MKAKIMNKALAWLMTVSMLLSLMPGMAFATEVDGVAQIGTQGYETLQAAIDAAVDGDTITLLADVTEDVTITQKEGLDLTIDGQNKTFTGVMTVFGNGRQSGAETLTIRNVVFQTVENATSCIVSPDRTVNNAYSYSHNVTVEGCTFKGSVATPQTAAAIRHQDGGDKNWTVTDCTVDENMHSLLQVNNVAGKLTITDCEVYSKNGVNLNSCTNVEITGCAFDVQGYAVRAGVTSGGNLGEAKSIVLNNNTLKSACDDGDAVIMLRASAVDVSISMAENVVSGTTHISGTTEATTVSADANYWDGQAAPVVEGSGVVEVATYYADEALADLRTPSAAPSGTVTPAYTRADGFWGEGTSTSVESFVVELYEGEAKIASASLNNIGGIIDGDVYVTWSIPFAGSADEYWAVEWAEGYPKYDMAPDAVKLLADGVQVAANEVQFNAPDDLNKIYAAVADDEGKFTAYYTDIQEAIVAAAPSGTVGILADVTVDEWVMIAESLTIGNDNLITCVINGLTINGNGHTLTINNIESAGNGGYLFFDATKLNVNDLTIKYADGLAGAIALKAGTLNNVTFDGCVYGVIPQSGDVVIQNCTFKTTGTSIYFDEERDGLTVTGCTFENADTVNVILLRGDVEFTNNTVVSGRTVNVVSGSPVVTGNKFNDVRLKVYNEATATISNNTINNLVFNDDSVQQSTFSGNTLSDSAQAALDAVTAVPTVTYVAYINTQGYDTLQAAIDAAVDGDTITLLADLTIESDLSDAGKGYFNIADGKKVTIDLNGHTISATDNSTGNFILFYNYGELTIRNGTVNLTATNDRDWNAESAIILNRGGILNVESGTYTHKGGTDMAFVVDNSGNYYGDATTNIEGGTLTSTYTAIRNRMEQNEHGASGKAILNISGGEISGTTSAVWAQAASVSTTAPATGAINVSGGTVSLINTARSAGAECMTTISGGTVAGFKGEVGELTVKSPGKITGEITILTATNEAVDYVVDENGVYVEAPAVVVVNNTEEAQAALDAAKDGTTIQLVSDVSYGVLYVGRPTKSNDTTMYCETHEYTTTDAAAFAEHLADSQWHTTPRYTTNLKNVTIIGAEGATVAGVVATSGHIYGDVYDYVLDKDYDGGSAYYSTLNISNLTFNAVNFTGKIDINTSDATSVYDGVHFVGCTFTTGGTASTNGAAIRYYNEANNGNVKNITVDNCTFTNCYQGVYVHHVSGVTVSGSAFNTTGHNAIALQNHDGAVDFGTVVISGNTFVNISDRVIRLGDVGAESAISIEGNTITDSGDEDGELIKATSIADGATITRTGNTWNGVADENLVWVDGVLSMPVTGLSGSGTEADPYFINNLDELIWFRDDVNSGNTYAGKYVKLAADIDLGSEEWAPIGNSTNKFQGTFDGGEKTISNLVITGSNSNVGLFGYTTNGEIKNLTVSNALVSGRLNVGVVAGTPYTSKYTNITVTGHVEVNGFAYVGGVGGKNAYASWTDITVEVDDTSYVKAISTEDGTAYRTYVGGVIGFMGEGGHTFKNISSNIKVIGDVRDIGGITGIAHYGNNFINVTCSGAVVCIGEAKEIGGIAGVWHNQVGTTVTFTDVAFTGTVTDVNGIVTGCDMVGGAYNANNSGADNSGTLTVNGSVVWPVTAVAQVGEEKYETLADALLAAGDGDTVTLLADITLTETLTIPAGAVVTLELNGKTISQTKEQTAGYQMILNDGALTIEDSVGTGKISYTDSGNGGEYISDTIYNRGVLVINGGTIENLSSATVAANGYPHAVDTYSGIRDTSVTINGGTVYCAEYSAIRMFCVSAANKADLTITGGTIKGAVDMQNGTTAAALGTLTITGGTFETTKNANNIRFANWNGGAQEYGITASIKGGSFNGGISTAYVPAAANWNSKIISGGTFASDMTDFCADGYACVDNGDGTYGVKVALPEVVVTDIKDSLTDSDPDLTFALNFAIKDVEELTEEYLEQLFDEYGDWYTDYVLTISGLTDTEVVFNANGGADGYLAGQYDGFGPNWVSVPFEDVTVQNGESLYIMEYAAKLMGQSGLRYTLAEVATIVQNFDCGVYFTPEFLAANPDMQVELELKVFTEDAEGKIAQDISVATNDFDAADFAAAVTADGKQTQYFATLAAALTAAQDGDTVCLLADAKVDGKVVVDKAITIDGNGRSIIADESAVWYTVTGTLGIRKYNTHLLSINSDSVTLKDIVLDCNSNAAGINVYCAQDVVFDNVSIINATMGVAGLTVNGSTLTAKTALTISGNSVAIDVSNGSDVTSALGLTIAEGTVTDLGDKVVKFAEVAAMDVTNAVTAEGAPYFASKDNAYYYTQAQMNSRTTAYSNGLTLLTDVEMTKELKVNGTLDLNGKTLTGSVATGSSLTVTGEGTVTDGFVLTDAAHTLTGREGMNVTTSLEGYEVVYANGVYSVVEEQAEVKNPAADMTYSAYGFGSSGEGEKYRENFMIDLYGVYAEKSLVIELYSGETLVSTTTMRETDRDDETAIARPIEGTKTVNIVVAGRLSGSWDTVWHVAPSVEYYPDTAKIYADGVLVDTYTDAFDEADKADYAALPGVAKAETELFNVWNANMKFGDSLTMYYYVQQENIDATKDYYIQITKTYADGRENVVETYNESVWESIVDNGKDCYRVGFDGIAAKEMADAMKIQVFFADGTAASNELTYSVRDYAMTMLGHFSTGELATLLVDTLNYGAAAQTQFNYNVDNLANAQLTEAQQALATQSVTAENNLVVGTMLDNINLDLENEILLRLWLINVTEDMYATVSYTDHYNNQKSKTVAFSEMEKNGKYCIVPVDGLSVADGRQLVTCTIYNGEGEQVGQCVASVESYIAIMNEVAPSALYTEIMKFIDSAYKYFH